MIVSALQLKHGVNSDDERDAVNKSKALVTDYGLPKSEKKEENFTKFMSHIGEPLDGNRSAISTHG